MSVKQHVFMVSMSGYGTDVESAWQDAVEQFINDPGSAPEEVVVTGDEHD